MTSFAVTADRIPSVAAFVCALSFAGTPLHQKDVEYGRPGAAPLLLDLHVPAGPGPFPAAIVVHGGGFDEGSKSTNVRPLFDVLANLATHDVDVSKIALIGESAGGFLANYAGAHATPETQVAAVVDFCGPTDYGKLAQLRQEHPERCNMAPSTSTKQTMAAFISSA